uniref:Uncharacterized protein n=1 Tax=Ciona intestinalis TaxID=7719 RepID=F6ZPI9_CIOIN
MKCAALILLCCVIFLTVDLSAAFTGRYVSLKKLDDRLFDAKGLREIARANLENDRMSSRS